MQQRDYLLREIEKIGILLRAILGRLTGRKDEPAITMETRMNSAKEQLLHEAGFDLDRYLAMDASEAEDYISRFKGFNPANVEALAEILYSLGIKLDAEQKQLLLGRSLELLEWCTKTDMAFSFEREARVSEIRSALQDHN